jgi:hypothetical protein
MDTTPPDTHSRPTSNLVHNEQTRLLATTLNSVATIVIIAGLLVLAASLFGLPPMVARPVQIAAAIIAIAAAIALHLRARAVLGRLRE